jgi:hypothetical protein
MDYTNGRELIAWAESTSRPEETTPDLGNASVGYQSNLDFPR